MLTSVMPTSNVTRSSWGSLRSGLGAPLCSASLPLGQSLEARPAQREVCRLRPGEERREQDEQAEGEELEGGEASHQHHRSARTPRRRSPLPLRRRSSSPRPAPAPISPTTVSGVPVASRSPRASASARPGAQVTRSSKSSPPAAAQSIGLRPRACAAPPRRPRHREPLDRAPARSRRSRGTRGRGRWRGRRTGPSSRGRRPPRRASVPPATRAVGRRCARVSSSMAAGLRGRARASRPPSSSASPPAERPSDPVTATASPGRAAERSRGVPPCSPSRVTLMNQPAGDAEVSPPTMATPWGAAASCMPS